ncbi:hypothetical protein D3C72_1091580 [compost metagenome]
MAESKAATWITRKATSAINQTTQTLTRRERAGLQSNQAQTIPLSSMNKVGSNEP